MPNTQPNQPTTRRTITDDIREMREGQAPTAVTADIKLDDWDWTVLSDVRANPGTSAREIAVRTWLDQAAVEASVSKLIAKGLVRRDGDRVWGAS